jgi:sirohydrochlorin ferrochelatase
MLIVIAHGSRREASNEEVGGPLAARLRAQASAQFNDVQAGFLEVAEPSTPAALAGCVARRATSHASTVVRWRTEQRRPGADTTS